MILLTKVMYSIVEYPDLIRFGIGNRTGKFQLLRTTAVLERVWPMLAAALVRERLLTAVIRAEVSVLMISCLLMTKQNTYKEPMKMYYLLSNTYLASRFCKSLLCCSKSLLIPLGTNRLVRRSDCFPGKVTGSKFNHLCHKCVNLPRNHCTKVLFSILSSFCFMK